MKNNFFFQLDSRLYYGIGKSHEIVQIIGDKDWRYIALLVDEGVAKNSEYYTEIANVIKKAVDMVYEIQLCGSEEPSYDYLDDVVAQVRGS